MRSLSLDAVVLTATFTLASCSSGASSPGTGPKATAGAAGNAGSVSGATSVFLPKSLNNPYWVDARKGMQDEAKKLGVKAQFLGPDTDDAAAQVAIFESILAKNPPASPSRPMTRPV